MRLFISYAHVDKAIVDEWIVAKLRAANHDVWIDDSLSAGQEWKPQLGDAIQNSDALVYAMTPESIASEVCQWEVKTAIELGKSVVPVLIQARTTIPDWLNKVQYVDFSAGATGNAVAKLIGGLQKLDANHIPPVPTTQFRNIESPTIIRATGSGIEPEPNETSKKGEWAEIIRSVQTPIGFLTFLLLVVNSTFIALAVGTSGNDRTILVVATTIVILVLGLGVIVASILYPKVLWQPSRKPEEDNMARELRVGDLVRIKVTKSFSVLRRNDGTISWNDDMKTHIGQCAKITEIDTAPPLCYVLDVDDGDNRWASEWLERLA